MPLLIYRHHLLSHRFYELEGEMWRINFASETITDNYKTDIDMKAKDLNFNEFTKQVANPHNIHEWQFLGNKPAIVDFYAPWCTPCRSFSPILDDVANDYDGKVDIYKINVDKEPELANAFNIRSIPTLLFIPQEENPIISRGAMTKSELIEAIHTHFF